MDSKKLGHWFIYTRNDRYGKPQMEPDFVALIRRPEDVLAIAGRYGPNTFVMYDDTFLCWDSNEHDSTDAETTRMVNRCRDYNDARRAAETH